MRLVSAFALACGALFVPLASAQAPVALMPGVSFEQYTELTSHGPVTYSVITAPAPTGLTAIMPVLGTGTITGPRETLTQLERSVTAIETVAGVSGDFFSGTPAVPSGIVMVGGTLERAPTSGRSSIGFDSSGTMHVGRISFTGTWRGTGQREPLSALNQTPAADQTALFTPAWGTSTPVVSNGAVAVLEPFPAAGIDTDLNATVTAVGDGSSPVAIPADGAVLVASGAAAASLQAEAPQGTAVTVRLILPSSWGSVVSALGGGPLLVRGGKPVFTTGESFSSVDLTSRKPRTAVGQLADGSVILVTVDGGRPGQSVGMTTYELAQTMAKLGAVTAAGLEFGKFATAAFDGRLLDRPQSGEQPIKEALLVAYQGVYAPAPAPQLLGAADLAGGESLVYRLVRPSTVNASLIGPDGAAHQVDAGSRQPGTYRFTWTSFAVEGTWHWTVQATDDQNRSSTADQTFQYDLTLSGLAVPRSASGGLQVGFTLSRPASVLLQISAANGTLVTTLPAVSLAAGTQSLSWDGTTAAGAKAPPGPYVATVSETSSIGTAASSAPFALHG